MNNISVQHITQQQFSTPQRVENYCIFMFKEAGSFSVDATLYHYEPHTLLFLSPYQHFQWQPQGAEQPELLQFHGDFYCIEYHKKEVACNGFLFNALFLHPYFSVSTTTFAQIHTLFKNISAELKENNPFSGAVLRSYLQLILALSSKEKSLVIEAAPPQPEHNLVTDFQQLIEQHFLEQRDLSFYADALCLTPDAFSKKLKKLLGKTPTKLLQERLILEAKKQLHLTYKSIKEIASYLNFDDEFYFSRFFKKQVGLSPKHFRESVGISVVAEKSM
jgi:transcriptional regulator, AraC family